MAKHLLNSLETSVTEENHGFSAIHDHVHLIDGCDTIVRKDYKQLTRDGKVMIICGGGSGHEPAQGGFVGEGMLTAAISGDIFAAPSAGKIMNVIRTVATKAQSKILLVSPDYTGDRLNFGLAFERAKLEGYNIETVIFGDDVSTSYGDEKRATTVGRRTMCGLLFAHKIAGAMAEEGASLAEIKAAILALQERVATLSLSLTSCSIPGTSIGESFDLARDEMELGLGIHGEAGKNRIKLTSAKKAVSILLEKLVGNESLLNEFWTRNKIKTRRVAVIINNAGGLSQFEMNIVVKEVMEQLETSMERKCVVELIRVGHFVTSFSMCGVAISILALDDKMEDNELIRLLNAPSRSGVWNSQRIRSFKPNRDILVAPILEESNEYLQKAESIEFLDKRLFLLTIKFACEELIKSEAYLNELDRECGDADTGSTLASTARYILARMSENRVKSTFIQMANLVDEKMCGTSGALYSLMFTSASKCIAELEIPPRTKEEQMAFWQNMLQQIIDRICGYGSAQSGDRSMIDALMAARDSLEKASNNSLTLEEILQQLVKDTREGAERTATMVPRVGRASYVNASRMSDAKPDPGAMAVSIWMKAVVDVVLMEREV